MLKPSEWNRWLTKNEISTINRKLKKKGLPTIPSCGGYVADIVLTLVPAPDRMLVLEVIRGVIDRIDNNR